ncbi:MAG: NfeD family protein [Bacteroidaceae bacterium]|nr:NfeD family protein [Bacteroidaceae bacterium]
MEELSNWFSSLDGTLQVFWGCAIVSSLIFLVQAALTLLGMDHDLDFDFDAANVDSGTMDLGGGLSLFSMRSLVNFFVGFGWAGISFYSWVSQKWLLYLIAVLVGIGFVWLYFFIRRQTKRLESDGTVDIKECVGKQCDVYLRIPARGSGQGKVQISLHGSVHEIAAVTDGEEIASGTHVRVLELIDGNVLKVGI